MDIALKYKLVEKIIQSENEELLSEVSVILGIPTTDFWSELPEAVRQSINEAKTQLDGGEGISHDVVIKDVKARFLKS